MNVIATIERNGFKLSYERNLAYYQIVFMSNKDSYGCWRNCHTLAENTEPLTILWALLEDG